MLNNRSMKVEVVKNLSHTLSYSLIALQEMNLAFRFPLIYWNCACLICNSGSVVTNDEDIKGTDYGKMAKAIGEVIQEGIKISLIDINHSNYSFVPDVKNNTILFGLKGVNKIGDPIIDQIIANRPYTGIIDFMNKCPLNKTAMVSLIQAGAFDELDKEWAIKINPEPRVGIMSYYISQVCGFKNKLTLVHFNELMKMDLLPESLSFQKRLYTFNKYLKDNQKVGKYYVFDNPCLIFYEEFFELDMLEIINGYTCILQTKWDKIYKNNMDKAREWLKENQEELLKKINQDIFKKAWDKYASDTISAWEMNSVCFYFHEHELSNIDKTTYGLSDFGELSTEPEIQYTFRKGGKEIPIFKTHKIIGTVIAKDDLHSSITLLTTSGVATVKFSKEYYANFNKQISEKQEDGTKKVMEKSCFTRGTKVMVTGFRRENTFIAKSYKHTPTHQFYRITEINGKDMNLEHERYQPQN